jgi:hypothetical protein
MPFARRTALPIASIASFALAASPPLLQGCGGSEGASPGGGSPSSGTSTAASGAGAGGLGFEGATGSGGSGGSGTGTGAPASGGAGGTSGTSTAASEAGAGGATGSGGSGGSGTGTGAPASGGAGGTSGSAGGAPSAGAYTSGVGGAPTVEASCQGKVYACGDLLDNDGDQLVDSQDPDCLGPCDNTEDSYYGGIPGQPGPGCIVDCYFDQDSGSGNDDCRWNHRCDPHEIPPDYYPESPLGDKCAYDPEAKTPGTDASCTELQASQSKACHDYCGPLTPNGCDCFGCCNLPAGSGSWVWLGSENEKGEGTCSLDVVNDPDKCQPCLPVAACLNDCGPCELCIGKPTVPPECTPDGGMPASGAGGGGPSGSGGGGATGAGGATGSGGSGGGTQCPPGVDACGLPGQPPCPLDKYCISGCCQSVPK